MKSRKEKSILNDSVEGRREANWIKSDQSGIIGSRFLTHY